MEDQGNSLKNFSPRVQSIPKQIADKIQQMVMDGELKPGERLPAERKLSADLGVSRNIIREALIILEERGIVTINIGSGTYIVEPKAEAVNRSLGVYVQRKKITVGQMFEVRWTLEVENARLAALNISEKQLAQLATSIEKMKASISDLETFTSIDIHFHQLLAHASQNPLFPLYLNTIQEVLHKQAIMATALPNAPQNAINHHENIYEAVKNHNGAAARDAMAAHLESAWDHILQVKKPQETIGFMRFEVSELDDI
ncbi:FadR/GntR family transcriptional regulator [Anaerolineales bacterium]